MRRRWSPDGKYISFLSSRPGPAKGNQVWVLERSGGEARQLTQFKGGVTSYRVVARLPRVWRSCVGTVATRAQPTLATSAPTPRQRRSRSCIDSYQFKRDGQTYLTGNATTRIFIFEVATPQGSSC